MIQFPQSPPIRAAQCLQIWNARAPAGSRARTCRRAPSDARAVRISRRTAGRKETEQRRIKGASERRELNPPTSPTRRRSCPAWQSRPTNRRRCRNSCFNTKRWRVSMPRSAPRSVLSNVWCGFGRTTFAYRRKGQCGGGPYEREAIRPQCWALRRHARRGRKPPGDAVLSRQRRIDGTGLDHRHQSRQRPE